MENSDEKRALGASGSVQRHGEKRARDGDTKYGLKGPYHFAVKPAKQEEQRIYRRSAPIVTCVIARFYLTSETEIAVAVGERNGFVD